MLINKSVKIEARVEQINFAYGLYIYFLVRIGKYSLPGKDLEWLREEWLSYKDLSEYQKASFSCACVHAGM